MLKAIKTGNHIDEEFQLICTKLIPMSHEYSTVVDRKNKTKMINDSIFSAQGSGNYRNTGRNGNSSACR